MKPNKNITIKGDRGYGTYKVKTLYKCRHTEIEFFKLTGIMEHIWAVELEDGSLQYMVSQGTGWFLDPFIKDHQSEWLEKDRLENESNK